MKLEKELDNVIQMIVKMAEQVEENLKNAFSIYQHYDENKLDLINDDLVDLHERLIEETCLTIMLRERPYSRDLRMVTGILQCVGDVERLGDHAEDIRDFATKLKDEEHHQIKELDQVLETVLKMVDDSIFSFINRDINLANEVIKQDDIVDDLYLENAIRISGTPLWDDDVYSNDLDLYANYANYDITTHSDLYDLQNNKYKLNEVLNYFDESNEYVFGEVRQVLNEKQIINNYRYFYYEDFTGKRYYTVENLNNIIEKLDKTYNTSNNIAHIQKTKLSLFAYAN